MAKKSIINKIAGKERAEASQMAAESVVEMEMAAEQLKVDEQRQREKMIAQCHEMIGQIRAVKMMSKFGDVASLVWAQDVKNLKLYLDLPGLGTWEKFCDYIGISRRKMDEDLQNLSIFGEDFMATVAGLSVGYKDLRKLRQISHDGDIVIDAECVTIGEEQIPLSSEHTEDLQAAIENLLESKNREIEDQAATIRASQKVMADKEKVLNRQAKTIARLEGKAEVKGLSAEEETICQKLDNSRTIIDGFLMEFDPEKNPLPEKATVRMRAKLMHTLDYFKRVVDATYDTAADIYGDPEIDDDWVPPHLRRTEGETDGVEA